MIEDPHHAIDRLIVSYTPPESRKKHLTDVNVSCESAVGPHASALPNPF